MVFSMTSASPVPRRRVVPVVMSRFGLLDAVADPQLTPIAGTASTNAREVVAKGDVLPLRAGRAGLLDALDGAWASSGNGTQGVPETVQVLRRYPVRSRGLNYSDDDSILLDAAKQIWGGIAQAGKDTWTGYRIGASGMYDTAGDAVGLLNRANDFMTELTGVGQMSEGTIWKDAEDWLHKTALEVAPRPEDIPTTFGGKVYAGIGQAPAELVQLLTAARLVGPIAGIAGLEGVRESENGWEAASEAAAKGAVFGLVAKALDPLNWVARSGGLAGLGAASGIAEGEDTSDAIAGALPLSLLGALGVPQAKQPDLLPLRLAYDDFIDAANHARNRLDVVRGLSPRRRRQEVVQINQTPGLLLQDVARRSDDLLGYRTTPGKQYKLPSSPLMLEKRIYDYGRSKWWKRFEDMEVKRQNARYPRHQWLADEYRKSEGARVSLRREDEILRQARIQLGKEGRFDAEARKLARLIRDEMRGRARSD